MGSGARLRRSSVGLIEKTCLRELRSTQYLGVPPERVPCYSGILLGLLTVNTSVRRRRSSLNSTKVFVLKVLYKPKARARTGSSRMVGKLGWLISTGTQPNRNSQR
ncbi:hypothetical protein CEXT_145301 [Caerostris extrusa]|uniref:Uncharacterized protein n=1 Tax=Caerostris extrusa TaxID=172846 RepID=A0AAV4PTG5_CAEEX|nr:hypothetical protein CEXT_145301 [Caerostris extrusa]